MQITCTHTVDQFYPSSAYVSRAPASNGEGSRHKELRWIHKEGSSMTRIPLTCCHASSLAFGAWTGTSVDLLEGISYFLSCAPSHQPRLKQPQTAKAILEEEASSLNCFHPRTCSF